MTKCVVLLLILSILHGSSPLGLPLTTAGCCSPSSSSTSLSSPSLIGRRLRSSTNSLPSSSGHPLSASAASTSSDTNNNNDQQEGDLRQLEQNSKYIMGLISNLEVVLDKWIITGSMATRRRAYNILQQIHRLSLDNELYKRAERLVKRSGMPMEEPPPVLNPEHVPATDQPSSSTSSMSLEQNDNVDRRMKNAYSPMEDDSSSTNTLTTTDDDSSSSCGGYIPIIKTGQQQHQTTTTTSGDNRINLAEERLQWEREQQERNALEKHYNTVSKKKNDNAIGGGGARSALSARMQGGEKTDPFVSNMVEGSLDPLREFANDKKELQGAMSSSSLDDNNEAGIPPLDSNINNYASIKASELIARAGSGNAFMGKTLGVGGLDDVLSEIQRRVWIPLAAPPSLLHELGIQPVRGLLLYGSPGCGKTLLARKLGSILSPARPITIVSGPEILDKFVGSSEKNLRDVFDNPPELYFHYKKNYGEELAKTALHVIVLDEFDAISRTRGGAGGKGDQGDAGVARDSVVNQLLAKMDGVDDLGVPTLLIGLTNKPSLIDPALMRPGRFEVQINVPKPKTVAQRVAILKVHMENMIKSGRVLVRDCPEGTPAWKHLQSEGDEGVPSFDELLDLIAVECDGMSGASLAGVSRAAASRALERAVTDFAGTVAQESMFGGEDNGQNSIANCLVTFEDFERAVEDVFESAKGGDYVEPSKTEVKSGAEIRAERSNNFNQGEFQNLKTLLPTRKITKDTWRQ